MDVLFIGYYSSAKRGLFISQVHEDINTVTHQGQSKKGMEYSAITGLKQDLKNIVNFSAKV